MVAENARKLADKIRVRNRGVPGCGNIRPPAFYSSLSFGSLRRFSLTAEVKVAPFTSLAQYRYVVFKRYTWSPDRGIVPVY